MTTQNWSYYKLSGSTDGLGILVAATGTTGTTIHTAVSGTTEYDQVFLWVTNNSASAVLLNIEYGEAGSSPTTNIQYTVPSKYGSFPILPGFPLQNGKVVTAFAGSTNVLVIHGWVLRSTTA